MLVHPVKPSKRKPLVFIVFYTALLLIVCGALCLVALLTARCARRLPILDEDLPWTLHRDQVPPAPGEHYCGGEQQSPPDPPWWQQG